MCIHVDMYTSTCTCMSLYECMSLCMYVCMYACAQFIHAVCLCGALVWLHVCMHACMHVCMHGCMGCVSRGECTVRVCMHACMHMWTMEYVYTYLYIYTCVYTHIIHTDMRPQTIRTIWPDAGKLLECGSLGCHFLQRCSAVNNRLFPALVIPHILFQLEALAASRYRVGFRPPPH